MNKKGFSLIEVLIGIGIFGILVVLLFKVFALISLLTVKMENETNFHKQYLIYSQTLQNLIDSNRIDFEKYGTGLIALDGFTGSLYLTGNGVGKSVFLSGSQNSKAVWYSEGTEQFELVNSSVFLMDEDSFFFKIQPVEYSGDVNYGFHNISHFGVQNGGRAYYSNYSDVWTNKIDLNFQSFYNSRFYDF